MFPVDPAWFVSIGTRTMTTTPRVTRTVAVAGPLLAALALACSAPSPVRVDRPPVIDRVAPPPGHFDVLVGDTLPFRVHAVDPDGDAVSVWWSLGDSVVAREAAWSFVAADTGHWEVCAHVGAGGGADSVVWDVDVTRPVNRPPQIVGFEPVEPDPTMVVGEPVTFSVQAVDPESEPLDYAFALDGSVVGHAASYRYSPVAVGNHRLVASVRDAEHERAHEWNIRVLAEADTIVPATVGITRFVTGAEPGDVDLEWIAVGDDGMAGRPSNYLVRTSPTPIETEEDWVRASRRPAVPPPAAPGDTMRMTLAGITPAQWTHVAVRAVDDFGNLSALSASPGARARGYRFGGVVLDALTRQPVAGAIVRFQGRRDTTDASGRWELREVGPEIGSLVAQDEEVEGVTGAYFDYVMGYTAVHLDEITLWLIPNVPLESTMYVDFLAFFLSMTPAYWLPGNPYQMRWNLPVDLHVPPASFHGLDYDSVIVDVAGQFDADLGEPTFRIVPQDPATGVRVEYSGSINRDFFDLFDWDGRGFPVHGRIVHRTSYSPAFVQSLVNVSRHELGHALGLRHSVDPIHVMVDGPAPSRPEFSPDERAVLRVFYHLPRGWRVLGFRRD